MKRLFFVFFFLGFVSIQAASGSFDSTVVKGINLIYNIKFNEADHVFKEVVADYPDHPAGKFFLAMIDWWKILLDPDNEAMDDLFFARLEDVIFQCDQILKKNPENVDALFFKGGAIGFRGRLRAIRESWIKAADDGREALPIVNRAYKLNPSNVDVQLGFGIYNYYAAVIPQKYPMVKPLMLFFPAGDKAKGIKELTDAAFKGKYTRTESKYFLMQLYYQFEEDFSKAEEFAKLLNTDFPDNPLFQRYFGRINVKKGNFQIAEGIFKNIYDKCLQGYAGYNNTAKREASYYLGYYRKNRGELDSSIVYFKQCEDISRKIDGKETSGFLINALLYLGELYDLKGDRGNAINNYKQLLDLKEFGQSRSLAKQYLEKPYGK